MATLVLAVDQSSWMMFTVPQELAIYWNATVDQPCLMTAPTFMMLVWAVKVILLLQVILSTSLFTKDVPLP